MTNLNPVCDGEEGLDSYCMIHDSSCLATLDTVHNSASFRSVAFFHESELLPFGLDLIDQPRTDTLGMLFLEVLSIASHRQAMKMFQIVMRMDRNNSGPGCDHMRETHPGMQTIAHDRPRLHVL